MLKQIALGMVLLAGLLVGTAWADDALNEALWNAAKGDDRAKVEALISKGADVNAKDRFYGITMLGWASNKEVAELLISKGADVNAKDNNGMTPLYHAATFGKKEIVELLISNGADVNAKNKYGWTPLHRVAEESNKGIAEILISAGADVNAKANGGGTPLHNAAYYGKKEVAELLISKGADMNAKDDSGDTTLDRATEAKQNEFVTFLQAAMRKQDEMAALLQAALQNKSGNQREIFSRVMVNYKDRAMSDDIRRPFIALAAKLKPAPAVPEEARKYLIRGNALMGDAKNLGEARAAVQEYQNALLAAPWWDDAYFNLSKAQELAGDLDGAYSSMQYYLLTEPQDKREAQDRLYAFEAKRDKAKGK